MMLNVAPFSLWVSVCQTLVEVKASCRISLLFTGWIILGGEAVLRRETEGDNEAAVISLWHSSSTGYHSKPEQFFSMFQCHITPLNKTLRFKVRSVLKNSGISLSDGHWNFQIWTREGREKQDWKFYIANPKSWLEPPFVTQKLGFTLEGHSTFTFE